MAYGLMNIPIMEIFGEILICIMMQGAGVIIVPKVTTGKYLVIMDGMLQRIFLPIQWSQDSCENYQNPFFGG